MENVWETYPPAVIQPLRRARDREPGVNPGQSRCGNFHKALPTKPLMLKLRWEGGKQSRNESEYLL